MDCEESFEWMTWREFKGSELMHAGRRRADGEEYEFGKLSERDIERRWLEVEPVFK